MGLTTLYERREREDAIQYFKIEKGLNLVKYATPNRLAPAITSSGPASSIRGYSHRLERQAIKNAIKENSSSQTEWFQYGTQFQKA